MQQDLEQISGSVDHIIFRSDQTGFTVLELNTGEELVCVVGEFSGVEAGEELVLTGSYTTHPTYGYQFKAEAYERNLPATANAIYKYLSSKVIKGIGPATARRIVDEFGDETLTVIENSPLMLSRVKGISEKKAMEICGEFKQIFGIRTVMLFLNSFGITAAQAIKVWKKWGSMAVEMIQDNPYILCNEEFEVNFAEADEIAAKLTFPKDSPCRIQSALRYVLVKNLGNGHTCLPRQKLLDAACRVLELPEDDVLPILEEELADGSLFSIDRGEQTYLYLPVMLTAESYITSRLTLMVSTPEEEMPHLDDVIDAFERDCGITYADLQRQAVKQALQNQVMILTGGPGTGKTTTLNAIIRLLEQQGSTVLIAAPTGRAAKRISEVTGKDAKTIHRLLEVEYGDGDKLQFARNEQSPLKCDAVVIDEMSMIDTLLFDSLLRALPMKAKLIMVGDSDQLPSVGAGNILKDLIESGCIPTVQLTEIFRQAAQSLIVTNAHRIVSGVMPELSVKDNDFFFLQRTDMAAAQQTVLDLCAARLPKSYGFSSMDDIQVLCPSRKSELGVIELNHRLQDVLNPPSADKAELRQGFYTFRTGDKVMQVRNNYDIAWTRQEEKGLGIFNGDIGIIRSIDKAAGMLLVDFDGREAFYTAEMSAELELAYAITVHKSQGSEFNAVVLPVLGGFDKLYFRNLLYTAVTRAKKILIIVGSQNRLRYMVENNRKMLRYTGLKYFLSNGIVF